MPGSTDDITCQKVEKEGAVKMKPSLNSYRLDCHSLHPLESIS